MRYMVKMAQLLFEWGDAEADVKSDEEMQMGFAHLPDWDPIQEKEPLKLKVEQGVHTELGQANRHVYPDGVSYSGFDTDMAGRDSILDAITKWVHAGIPQAEWERSIGEVVAQLLPTMPDYEEYGSAPIDSAWTKRFLDTLDISFIVIVYRDISRDGKPSGPMRIEVMAGFGPRFTRGSTLGYFAVSEWAQFCDMLIEEAERQLGSFGAFGYHSQGATEEARRIYDAIQPYFTRTPMTPEEADWSKVGVKMAQLLTEKASPEALVQHDQDLQMGFAPEVYEDEDAPPAADADKKKRKSPVQQAKHTELSLANKQVNSTGYGTELAGEAELETAVDQWVRAIIPKAEWDRSVRAAANALNPAGSTNLIDSPWAETLKKVLRIETYVSNVRHRDRPIGTPDAAWLIAVDAQHRQLGHYWVDDDDSDWAPFCDMIREEMLLELRSYSHKSHEPPRSAVLRIYNAIKPYFQRAPMTPEEADWSKVGQTAQSVAYVVGDPDSPYCVTIGFEPRDIPANLPILDFQLAGDDGSDGIVIHDDGTLEVQSSGAVTNVYRSESEMAEELTNVDEGLPPGLM